jgi:hypothetical protein
MSQHFNVKYNTNKKIAVPMVGKTLKDNSVISRTYSGINDQTYHIGIHSWQGPKHDQHAARTLEKPINGGWRCMAIFLGYFDNLMQKIQ